MARQQMVELDPYEGLRTGVRWKASDAARVLADWRQSGESMTAFVRRHGLALHRLHSPTTEATQATRSTSTASRQLATRPEPDRRT